MLKTKCKRDEFKRINDTGKNYEERSTRRTSVQHLFNICIEKFTKYASRNTPQLFDKIEVEYKQQTCDAPMTQAIIQQMDWLILYLTLTSKICVKFIIIIIRQPLCPVAGQRPRHVVSKLPCLVLSSAISCRSGICPGRLSTAWLVSLVVFSCHMVSKW